MGDDSEDNSDNNLEIVIDSPNSKRRTFPEPSKSEKLIIETFEDELQRRLEEKAAKTNLNATNVKNIIKHVVTNEHVLALVKKAENHEYDELIPYEPKLTRAKAKELLSSVPDTWNTLKPASGVQVLFTEDLQEDSSGDEYVPCEEESEDDRDGSIVSDPPSVQPPTPTPLANIDSCTETNLTDDGIFKIPPSKSKEDIEEEANIALRTRSKLSLSSTPLEVIEEAFIPPDITTDMYDMDYDNDDWIDFLKKFTRPLDEVAKPTEDEEHDPEYNILADAEIDKIDKEELRVDKAVKISRKELNNLIAELFDSELCTTSNSMEMGKKNKSTNENNEVEVLNYYENAGITDTSLEREENMMAVMNEAVVFEEGENILIKRSQIPLLQQQMRQHIQLLTQNFILTYQHPELHNYSIQTKEYMMNLKFLCEGKEKSVFYAVNLFPAIQLIEHWEHFLATDSVALKNLKRHIEKTMAECIKCKQSGNSYFPSFPQLILETISNSEVFLYPFLLPKIPFKPNTFFARCIVPTFTDSEDQLIALGLEQFESLLKRNRKNLTKTGEVILKQTCSFIQEYMMPHRDTIKIYHHINCFKKPRCGNNPIKYYFQYKKAPPVVHLVSPLDELQILPPCKRLPDHLPYQWKIFNYPNLNVTSYKTPSVASFNLFTEQVQHSCVNILNPEITTLVLNSEKLILPKKAVTSTPIFSNRRKIFAPFKRRKLYTKTKGVQQQDPITKFVKCLSRPSVINRLFGHDSDSAKYKLAEEINSSTNLQPIQIMLPNMPSLGTPIKTYAKNEVSNGNPNKYMNEEDTNTKNGSRKYVLPEISTISSSSFQRAGTSTEVEFCRPLDNSQTIASISKRESSGGFLSSSQVMSHNNTCNEKVKDSSFTSIDKDNVDSTPNLTVKPSVRKEPSGAEKKRAKLRKEFLANLSVTAPEDPDIEKQKSEMFALAYYDKMRENLELEDYHKIMQILNDHEEGDAADLYKKIEKVLVPKYQELADEFLLFLREKEAAAVDQLIPWITMNNRSKFLRKLEIYFKDQPAQLRKIYKCLTELSLSLDVSMEKIKSTLLPMFKGNSVLTDLFLQNFLSERPPLSLLEGPYETIDVAKELPRQDNEEILETITVPDTEDKYGGPSCICNCHQIEDPEFKSRYRHCIRCGTRFINGKVFIQSGKGLRPATVSFTTNPTEDHSTRLTGKTAPSMAYHRKKGSESSSSKQISLSPPKENPDEETEDETDGKKKSKRSTKKKLTTKTSKSSKEPAKNVLSKKKKTCKTNRNKFSISPINKEFKPNRKESFSVKKSKIDKKADEQVHENIIAIKAGATVGQQKRLAEDSMEWEHNQISSDLKPNSPDQQTAESESEFCEESSQDNCESDSNSSISSINNQSQSDSNTGEECLWKREEDKIILETFQKENDKEHAFKIIANQLKNRTVIQISNRFQTLMTLLLETLGNS